ncbi:MAG: transcription factor FapR [Peptococcaceae bacterium]|nr:transcription factor FapR [Peptococcaceae bacterium]
MPRNALDKSSRQSMLGNYLSGNPFLTDGDLAEILGVSIQTVRLDRSVMKIPEMRARIKTMARGVDGKVRSMEADELTGDLVELNVGQSGVSLLTVNDKMTSKKTRVAKGYYLFAQANSLAVALIDSDLALTGTCKISFKSPVVSGEKVVARARISRKSRNRYMVRVSSTVKDELVFLGRFLIIAISEEAWQR